MAKHELDLFNGAVYPPVRLLPSFAASQSLADSSLLPRISPCFVLLERLSTSTTESRRMFGAANHNPNSKSSIGSYATQVDWRPAIVTTAEALTSSVTIPHAMWLQEIMDSGWKFKQNST
jgi:hypothetical protein